MKPRAILFWFLFTFVLAFVPAFTALFDGFLSPIMDAVIQPQWDKLLEFVNKEEKVLFVTIGVAGTVFFWLFCAPFTICDLTGWPKWMTEYKTNEEKAVPIDRWQFTKAFIGTVFNQLVLGPLILPVALQCMHKFAIFGATHHLAALPKPSRVFTDVAFCFLCEDMVLWACHITFHKVPLLWKLHKWHHVWLHPTAIVGIYCHPLEQLFVNMPAFFSGLILSGCHPFTYGVFLFCGLHNVVVNHCGYHLPFMFSGEHHDFHHLSYNYCFGAYGFADWLFGTEEKFDNGPQYKRDTMSFSLTPLTKLYPNVAADSPKKAQ
jgi:sterol desaturase/sphingolipid hydroxylase (fatty acid hydroxylase superfamily)